ncbi:unnamed protein product, partial [Ixodes pacificus]
MAEEGQRSFDIVHSHFIERFRQRNPRSLEEIIAFVNPQLLHDYGSGEGENWDEDEVDPGRDIQPPLFAYLTMQMSAILAVAFGEHICPCGMLLAYFSPSNLVQQLTARFRTRQFWAGLGGSREA